MWEEFLALRTGRVCNVLKCFTEHLWMGYFALMLPVFWQTDTGVLGMNVTEHDSFMYLDEVMLQTS